MYNDYSFYKNCLGLWISYTLTNKKKNSIIYKHITRMKKKKTKKKQKINLRQKNYLTKEEK